jgi:NAD(P)-dependent dehydrogenase (short-subunit alcohol dehydrogenase family)
MIIDLLRLDGRVVVVTGAGGSIGTTMALTLAEAGARIVLVDLDDASLQRVSHLFDDRGWEHLALTADTCDIEAFGDAVARTVDRYGAVDGLVCLVGGVEPDEFGPLLGHGVASYDAIMDRNLRSAVVAHEATARIMAAQGGGSIVSISAATALASSPFHALYGAAKAALVALTRTEAVEWGSLGIRVNTVAPGAVETRPPADPEAMARWERAAIPLGRRVKPVEVAGAALFLLSDLASYVTGHTLVLDGGALAKPAFLDADNVPIFVTDPAVRERMRTAGPATDASMVTGRSSGAKM